MQYATLESVLVVVFGVKKADLGAFRARLRHLRTLGIPMVRRPGSGSKIEYDRSHVIQVAMALAFEEAGVSPADAAEIARKTAANAITEARRNKEPFFIGAAQSGGLGKDTRWVYGLGTGGGFLGMTEFAESVALIRSATLVNVGLLIGQVDRALSFVPD